MAPNITEILFALGLGGRIAGDTRFCDYPPAAAALPKIGGLVDPNVEIVASLRPDLIIAFRGNPLRVVDRMRGLGLPVFVLDIGEGLDALFPLVAKIGLVTRRESEAAALSAGLRARVKAVEDRLGGLNTASKPENSSGRPRVFVVLHSQGLWTSGGQGYLSDVIARAGAVNIAAPVPRKWVLYSRERIVRDNPDAIFILSRSHAAFLEARAWLSGEARLGGVAAVKAGRVYEIDENAASRFGPRLVDVLEAMARALHPERFKIGAVSTQCQKNWHCVDTAPLEGGGDDAP